MTTQRPEERPGGPADCDSTLIPAAGRDSAWQVTTIVAGQLCRYDVGTMINGASLHRDNHYVPRGYLKRFAAPDGHVWCYRTLVSHPQVPVWKPSSVRGVAYHSHLYTRMAAGRETDEVEKWLDQEFEAPAKEALRKATSGARLTRDDWGCLVRFLAAQDVRTPARLIESLERWHQTLPVLLASTLEDSVRKLELARASGRSVTEARLPFRDYVPLRVTTEIQAGEEFGQLKSELVVGRGLWLFLIRHLLTRTAKVLHRHRWTILTPPRDLNWFTSDDPVIKLNAYGDGKYDFKGGWDNPGTEILLPLSPRHLLYTQIGRQPPSREHAMPRYQADLIRRFCAEHAHRMIFAASSDADVPVLRPRIVNAELLREENEVWRKWHEDQTIAERKLMGWTET
ncbi:MAG TPA: DUF4238 domain-containing protein [Thermoanaerobaculia bacterium]|nr:DUF4238 domain-containing protein [Thermoanaerobaculia bacterium]